MKLTVALFSLVILMCSAGPARAASSVACEGHFINPITDICWDCLFPISIGSAPVAPGNLANTPNPASPIQLCPMGIFYRIGLAIGFWEPMAVTVLPGEPGGGYSRILVRSEWAWGSRKPKTCPAFFTTFTGTNIRWFTG